MLAAPSRAPSFTASAAVAPVSRSPSYSSSSSAYGAIRSHAVVYGSLGETIASAAVVIGSLAVDINTFTHQCTPLYGSLYSHNHNRFRSIYRYIYIVTNYQLNNYHFME